MLRLVIEDDEGQTTVVPLIRDEITIGRKDGNTIRLTERNISRRHARLHCSGDANDVVLLEDLDSYNGVRLNGEKIVGRAHIKPGDSIQIGDYRLALKLDQPLSEKPNEPSKVADESAPVDHSDSGTQVAPPPQMELPPELQAHFVALSSNLAGETWYIEQNEMKLGRTDENDLVINHRSISRNHAKILVRDQVFTIIDLASANGVRVNGQPYGSCTLRNGDIVELGQVKLRFVGPGDPYVFDRSEIEDVLPEGPTTLRMVLAAIILVAASTGTFCVLRARRDPPQPAPATLSMRLSDSEISGLIQEGRGYLAKKRWTEARSVFGRVLEARPDDPTATFGLKEAVRHYQQEQLGVRFKAEADAARWGEAFETLGKLDDEQLKTFESRIPKVKQGYAKEKLDQGRAMLRAGDLSRAREIWNQLREYPFAKSQAAALQVDIEREERQTRDPSGFKPPKQIANQKSRPEENKSGAAAFNVKGAGAQEAALLPKNDPPKAGDSAAVEVNSDPNETYESALAKGQSANESGETSKAIRMFLLANHLNPQALPPYFNLCQLYEKQGKYAEALKYCRKCLQLAPSDAYRKMIQKRIEDIESML